MTVLTLVNIVLEAKKKKARYSQDNQVKNWILNMQNLKKKHVEPICNFRNAESLENDVKTLQMTIQEFS